MKEKVLKMDLNMLENVSGGVMTENTELFIDETIGELKRRFGTKAEVITYVTDNYNTLFASQKKMKKVELINYIENNWEFL